MGVGQKIFVSMTDLKGSHLKIALQGFAQIFLFDEAILHSRFCVCDFTQFYVELFSI